ncbi:MAG: HAD-IA family hydrolase [Paracoccaceae bacterium]
MTLRLVVFDVDGTLVDSQGDIVGSLTAAFQEVGLEVPERSQLLSVVGLSLPQVMFRLAPDQSEQTRDKMIETYKSRFKSLRQSKAPSPFYSGARDALATLSKTPDVLLGVATGKSRRGLDALIDGYGLDGLFVTTQVADNHPSKPHPSMLNTAMTECGVEAEDTVMIGDTVFDMDMANAAGVAFIGVSWGYHPSSKLNNAVAVLDTYADLMPALEQHWRPEL